VPFLTVIADGLNAKFCIDTLFVDCGVVDELVGIGDIVELDEPNTLFRLT